METTYTQPDDPPPPPVAGQRAPFVSPVVKAMLDGRLIPFFGAGVNACGRPEKYRWNHGAADFLPTGGELARHLARAYDYEEDDSDDLLQVSQFASLMNGPSVLKEELRKVFNGECPPTTVHRFFASLPRRLRAAGVPVPVDASGCGYLIITTNYDDLLERALRAEGERFHTLTYIADGDEPGWYRHKPPAGAAEVMRDPEKIQFDGLPVVLKIHGAVYRDDPAHDSFVITEEHYIDCLARVHLFFDTLPKAIPARLQRANVLFLGYSLRDWNVRAMLHHLLKEQKGQFQSWAVLNRPRAVDTKMWPLRHVDIIAEDLDRYMAALDARLQTRLQPPPAPEQQQAA